MCWASRWMRCSTQYGDAGGPVLRLPLWDLMAKRASQPVYRLAATMAGKPAPQSLRVSCYDTSLYMDDLHLASDEEAAELLAAETRAGLACRHRAFKIKTGRGARHMPVEEGTRRDIAVIRAVRAAAGEGDPRSTPTTATPQPGEACWRRRRTAASTGWRSRFTRTMHFMKTCRRGCGRRAAHLIADGEGEASPNLLAWAQAGLVNVVQYDLLSYGFSDWLALGAKLDGWGVHSARTTMDGTSATTRSAIWRARQGVLPSPSGTRP